MLVSKNNVVACKPFVVATKEENSRKLTFITSKQDVVSLDVMFSTDPTDACIQVTTDDVVFVKAESLRSAWAASKFRLPGGTEDFVLVPLNEIVFIDKKAKTVN